MKENSYRILIVDDNASIHQDFKKILLENSHSKEDSEMQEIKSQLFEESPQQEILLQYEIDSAYQGEEALKLVKQSIQQKKPYSLAFIDVLMPPGWDGIETTKRIWEVDPDIQVVICTAYAQYSWKDLIEHLGVNDNFIILKKPFENIEIKQIACCLSQKWKLGNEAGHRYDRLYAEVQKETEVLKKMIEKHSTDGK